MGCVRRVGGDDGGWKLGDEVDDDGENGSRRITTPDATDLPSQTSALLFLGSWTLLRHYFQ